jgi:hypothetical protein
MASKSKEELTVKALHKAIDKLNNDLENEIAEILAKVAEISELIAST